MGTNIKMTKQASPKWLGLFGASTNVGKGFLTTALLAGGTAGVALAGIVNAAKHKRAPLRIAEEERKFYDAKVKEMANENWLNDMLTLRKKLDSKSLSDSERRDVEKEYLKLLESNIEEDV